MQAASSKASFVINIFKIYFKSYTILKSIYQIFAVHEYRYNAEGVSFLGKIIIIFGDKVYEIDDNFKV